MWSYPSAPSGYFPGGSHATTSSPGGVTPVPPSGASSAPGWHVQDAAALAMSSASPAVGPTSGHTLVSRPGSGAQDHRLAPQPGVDPAPEHRSGAQPFPGRNAENQIPDQSGYGAGTDPRSAPPMPPAPASGVPPTNYVPILVGPDGQAYIHVSQLQAMGGGGIPAVGGPPQQGFGGTLGAPLDAPGAQPLHGGSYGVDLGSAPSPYAAASRSFHTVESLEQGGLPLQHGAGAPSSGAAATQAPYGSLVYDPRSGSQEVIGSGHTTVYGPGVSAYDHRMHPERAARLGMLPPSHRQGRETDRGMSAAEFREAAAHARSPSHDTRGHGAASGDYRGTPSDLRHSTNGRSTFSGYRDPPVAVRGAPADSRAGALQRWPGPSGPILGAKPHQRMLECKLCGLRLPEKVMESHKKGRKHIKKREELEDQHRMRREEKLKRKQEADSNKAAESKGVEGAGGVKAEEEKAVGEEKAGGVLNGSQGGGSEAPVSAEVKEGTALKADGMNGVPVVAEKGEVDASNPGSDSAGAAGGRAEKLASSEAPKQDGVRDGSPAQASGPGGPLQDKPPLVKDKPPSDWVPCNCPVCPGVKLASESVSLAHSQGKKHQQNLALRQGRRLPASRHASTASFPRSVPSFQPSTPAYLALYGHTGGGGRDAYAAPSNSAPSYAQRGGGGNSGAPWQSLNAIHQRDSSAEGWRKRPGGARPEGSVGAKRQAVGGQVGKTRESWRASSSAGGVLPQKPLGHYDLPDPRLIGTPAYREALIARGIPIASLGPPFVSGHCGDCGAKLETVLNHQHHLKGKRHAAAVEALKTGGRGVQAEAEQKDAEVAKAVDKPDTDDDAEIVDATEGDRVPEAASAELEWLGQSETGGTEAESTEQQLDLGQLDTMGAEAATSEQQQLDLGQAETGGAIAESTEQLLDFGQSDTGGAEAEPTEHQLDVGQAEAGGVGAESSEHQLVWVLSETGGPEAAGTEKQPGETRAAESGDPQQGEAKAEMDVGESLMEAELASLVPHGGLHMLGSVLETHDL